MGSILVWILTLSLVNYAQQADLFFNYTVSAYDEDTYPTKVLFTIYVEAVEEQLRTVSVSAGKRDWRVGIYDPAFTGPELEDVIFDDDNELMTWNAGNFTVGQNVTWEWPSWPSDDGIHVGDDVTYFTATLVFLNTNSSEETFYATTCITREDVVETSVSYQAGMVVLALFMGLLAGAVVVVIVAIIVIVFRRRGQCGGTPSSGSKRDYGHKAANLKGGTGLILNAKEARGLMSIKNSSYSPDDSIVEFLAFKDKMKQNREFDNMDIQATVDVDMSIEKERNNAMVKVTNMLGNSLVQNGDLPKGTEDKCRQKFVRRLSQLEKTTEDDYKKEAEKIYARLSKKNKHKLGELMTRQAEQRADLDERLGNNVDADAKELLDLQKETHEAEQQGLQHLLKLEQDEEAEKLRKEIAVRKRIGIKAAQQDYIDDLIKEGQFDPARGQADWILKEHFKNQAAVERMYDDEISRQRMMLEEKLARRKALAAMTDAQEDQDSNQLNVLAGQHLGLLKKAKKDGTLTPAEAKQMLREAQKQMEENKEVLDKERERQEQALHGKLSKRKAQQMNEMRKRQEADLQALDKQINSGQYNPLEAMQVRQETISRQRSEQAEFENELDKEHADELAGLRKELADQTLVSLEKQKDTTIEQLKQEGMDEEAIRRQLNKHRKELADLKEAQLKEKESQQEKFEKLLAKKREEWQARRETEQQEQTALREHEEKIVQNLVDNQVAMSEEERLRIMQEHEKQMVKLENSLTLNKLSQKRMLEERIARKRRAQMSKLEKKQAAGLRKAKQSAQDSEDEMEAFELMKKHAEQRLAVLQGERLSAEEEMEEIKAEMTKERATALQDQEVKLAAMLAELQMAKAKEMARIEEQQKQIFNLKSNLMDDLNQKGVLTDPECQRVIQVHQDEQEKLNKKLESQRSKQEALLRKRLEERLAAKADQMSQMQKAEVRDLGEGLAAKLKRAALMEKHKLEQEHFRNRMEKEMNQTVEELHRQNGMRRLQSIQEQELQFLNGLVRLGKFDAEELENVVTMLFPLKTAEQRKEIMDRLCEGYKPPTPQPTKPGNPKTPRLERRLTSLEQRVLQSSYPKASMSSASMSPLLKGAPKRPLPPAPVFTKGLRRVRPESTASGRSSNLGDIFSDPDEPDFAPNQSFTGSLASKAYLGSKATSRKTKGVEYDRDFDESRSHASYDDHYGDRLRSDGYHNDPLRGDSYRGDGYRDDPRQYYGGGGNRSLDPLALAPGYGGVVGGGYGEPQGYSRIPASKLPPLETIGTGEKNKKKKKKKQIAASEDDDF